MKYSIEHPISPPMKPAQKKLITQSKISLWLDEYDDIFSDFDSRPYEQRALSDDFLSEARKFSRETASGEIELHLLLPHGNRNSPYEQTINRRLRDYFRKRHHESSQKLSALFLQGMLFVVFGIIFMAIGAFLLVRFEKANFWIAFLSVIVEPAGWFLFWEGGHLLIFDIKSIRSDLRFNEKMKKCKIYFSSY